jgi:predicted transcriptional regulator/DNA-directed RNA polymerase subunit M/transcription elongation factor TFIIS
MSTSQYKSPFIKEIFNVDKNGNKTLKSLYYQNILRFLLNDPNQFYKVREISNWLVDNVSLRSKINTEIEISKSKIVEDREKTFRKYLNNLTTWNLVIARETHIAKGTGSTYEYQLTNFGNLISLIIEVEFSQNVKTIYDKLYEHLEKYFTNKSYSVDKFCMSYLMMCKDKNLFKDFVNSIRNNIIYYNEYINNDNDFFTFMMLLRTRSKKINKKLWQLWEKSFKALDSTNKKFIQYHLKIFIDRLIENTIHDFKAYGKYRYHNKDDFSKLTIEFTCAKCNNAEYFYKNVLILHYLEAIFSNPKIMTSYLFNKLIYLNTARTRIAGSIPANEFKCSRCNNNKKFYFTII